ncbi:hypothetical protein D3C83_80500 [compost metagenome]
MPRGATIPYQPVVLNLSPLSAMVGNSGTSGERLSPPTARGRTRFARIWGSAADSPLNIMSTSPPISAVTPGLAPL